MSLAIDPQGAANPKLPLWDTICLSYSTYFHNFQDVLRITWLWLVVAALLTGTANWLEFPRMAEIMADLKQGMPAQMPPHLASPPIETILLGYAATLVLLVAGLSTAVAWHRRIILSEHPGFSGSNVATKNLWRYAGMGLAIFLIVGLPLLVVIVPMFLLLAPVARGGSPGFTILIPVIFFLLALVALTVALRLSLLLPARAVGDLGLTFKETWNRTRGNTWRILWGIAACTLPSMLAAQIALLVFLSPDMFADQAFVGRMTVASTIFILYYLLILPIGIGFLSHAYWHFFNRT
jgi:hypothetical protein